MSNSRAYMKPESVVNLVRRLMDVNLSDEPDTLHWKLSVSGVFSMKSMYINLINTGPIPKSLHI